MNQTNEKNVVREFIQQCNKAMSGMDVDPYALLTEDVDVFVNGHSPLSGRYPNREIVKNVLVDTAYDRIEKASVEVVELIGTGDRIAALLRILAETVDAKQYNPHGKTCGAIFTVKDGKITRAWLYPDTMMIESALYHKKFVAN